MRARLLLTGLALGATILVGGAATAQAAPASSGTTSTAKAAGYEPYPGTYSYSQCKSLRDSYAGRAYCDAIGGGLYVLMIWV
ncbi:hypothetical protein ACWGDT_27670 [Streptomyces avermitilis]